MRPSGEQARLINAKPRLDERIIIAAAFWISMLTIGGGLLGWGAAEMAASDPSVIGWYCTRTTC